MNRALILCGVVAVFAGVACGIIGYRSLPMRRAIVLHKEIHLEDGRSLEDDFRVDATTDYAVAIRLPLRSIIEPTQDGSDPFVIRYAVSCGGLGVIAGTNLEGPSTKIVNSEVTERVLAPFSAEPGHLYHLSVHILRVDGELAGRTGAIDVLLNPLSHPGGDTKFASFILYGFVALSSGSAMIVAGFVLRKAQSIAVGA